MNTIQFSIAVDHPCFAGHFPNFPLVPGALLLAWVRECVENELSTSIRSVSYAKFLSPAKPGDILTIHYKLKEGNKILVDATVNSQPVLKCSFDNE